MNSAPNYLCQVSEANVSSLASQYANKPPLTLTLASLLADGKEVQ